MQVSQGISGQATQTLVEKWISEIRARMPAGSEVTATLQAKAKLGFSACFRLRTEDEILTSEARSEDPDEAVAQAGKGLCEHLPSLFEEEVIREIFPRAS
jgi:hypothetical protein